MITYYVVIDITCDNAFKGAYIPNCSLESEQVFSKSQKNPAKLAKDRWKKEGWLITKAKTFYFAHIVQKKK